MEGFIKLFRKFYEWEWYDNPNTMRVFLHLLLKANYKDKNWHGIEVKRGQFLTSVQTLETELKLSRQQIRTAFKNLKSTGEITIRATRSYSLITIVKYSDYQDKIVDFNQRVNQENNHDLTNEQPQHNKEIKQEEKNEITTDGDRAISLYTENIGKPNRLIKEELLSYLKDTCIEAVEYAIKQAVMNGKPTCGYVRGILKNMIVEGVITPERVQAYIYERDSMNDTFKVFGKKEDPKKQYMKEGTAHPLSEFFDVFE